MIFGTMPVKIKQNGSFLTLDYSTAKYDWDKTINALESKDVFTGVIGNDFRTSYSEFEVTVNLFKLESYPAMISKWYDLYSLLHTTVDEFYPHADGYSIKDIDGNAIKYFVESVVAGQAIQGMNDHDIVTIKFVPLAGSESGYSVVPSPTIPTIDVTSSLNYWNFDDGTTQGWTSSNTISAYNGSNITQVSASVISGGYSLYVDVPSGYNFMYQSTPITFTSGTHYKLECLSKNLSADASWFGVCFFVGKTPVNSLDDFGNILQGASLYSIDVGDYYNPIYGFYNFTPTETSTGYVQLAFINYGSAHKQILIDNIRLSVITTVGARYSDGGSNVSLINGQLFF